MQIVKKAIYEKGNENKVKLYCFIAWFIWSTKVNIRYTFAVLQHNYNDKVRMAKVRNTMLQ